MNENYAPRTYTSLPQGTRVEHPPEMPESVYLDDPAMFVLIDFTRRRPVTVSSGCSIDVAMNKMVASGSHQLLVVSDDASFVGIVSACDIMGDAPVRVAQSNGIRHSEITVEMIMTPQKDIKAIDWQYVEQSKVGHIVATMHHLESCYLPVVEDGKLRGMFCANDMSTHIGYDIQASMICKCADSFSEIVYALADA
jgi:signal-transduction protein with cAMP-binding, CBS, and nucleotidyltransferase domain